jgi:hypothetical protein
MSYGAGGTGYLKILKSIIDFMGAKIILDYGCGKGGLVYALREIYPEREVHGYDPSNPEFGSLNIEKADLVICTDVLEHIPENILPSVLEKIADLSSACFFSLHHGKAATILPDGRNAHCTIKDKTWYEQLIRKYFGFATMLPLHIPRESMALTFWIPDELLESFYGETQDFAPVEIMIKRIWRSQKQMERQIPILLGATRDMEALKNSRLFRILVLLRKLFYFVAGRFTRKTS